MDTLFSIYNKIENAQELSDLNEVLEYVRKYLGFDYILYAIQYPTAFTRAESSVLGNYPRSWLDEYKEQGYVKIDPVIEHCFSSLKPFCWESFLQYGSDTKIGRFYENANKAGLYGGISIGIKGVFGTSGVISLACKSSLKANSKQYKKAVLGLNSFAPLLHHKIIEIALKNELYDAIPTLSERERDCLTWVAEGKTSGEIAMILSIVEPTVTYHLKKVIRKLCVSNRNQAIAKAVQLGLIQPNFPESPNM